MAPNSLTNIAADILQYATVLSEGLEDAGHGAPSLAPASPPACPRDLNREAQQARCKLIHAARQLQFLALGPTEALQWYALTGVGRTWSAKHPQGERRTGKKDMAKAQL